MSTTSLGAEPGDRVAVLEENCLASSDFFLGTAIGNFVRVPLYKRNSSGAHAHMLRQTQTKVLDGAGQLPESGWPVTQASEEQAVPRAIRR